MKRSHLDPLCDPLREFGLPILLAAIGFLAILMYLQREGVVQML